MSAEVKRWELEALRAEVAELRRRVDHKALADDLDSAASRISMLESNSQQLSADIQNVKTQVDAIAVAPAPVVPTP